MKMSLAKASNVMMSTNYCLKSNDLFRPTCNDNYAINIDIYVLVVLHLVNAPGC